MRAWHRVEKVLYPRQQAQGYLGWSQRTRLQVDVATAGLKPWPSEHQDLSCLTDPWIWPELNPA